MSEHATTPRSGTPSLLHGPSPEFAPLLSRSEPLPERGTATGVEERTEAGTARPWCTVVWNDPINLMSYVVFVLQRHFGYSRAHADTLMRRIHHEGRAVVSHGSRERMESDVQAMHGYGLHATLEQDGED